MQRDKVSHFWWGLAIALTISFIHPLVGLSAGILAGAAKEAWDSTGRGTLDLWDFIATALGALLGTGLFVVLSFLCSGNSP